MQLVRVNAGDHAVWARWDPRGAIVLDTGESLLERDVEFLPPVKPTKIIAVHMNYPCRLQATGRPQPRWPSYFLKPPSSLSGHRRPVQRPAGTKYLNFEGEVALVIGERAKAISRESALQYVAGITAACDYGLHDLRLSDRGANLRAKGQDGFCPVGPVLITLDEVDANNITVRTFVNGELVQEGNTGDLLFPFDYLVADLSRHISLEPGDLILTGTPAGSRPVQPGDVVEVEVARVCRLENRIEEAQVDFGDFGAQPEDNEDIRNVAFERPAGG